VVAVAVPAATAYGVYPIGDGAAPAVPAMLTDLDGWIAEREAEAGVREGLEARIVWHDPTRRRRTPIALVYLPGLGASPEESRPLSDSVAADLGANLYYHRPAGHVLRENSMAGLRIGDWLSDAREALAIGRAIGDRVVLIGMSNGGALATWAAIRHPEALDALVLLAPNFGPADPRAGLLTLPGGRLLVRLVEGETYSWEPENEAQASAWDTAYPSVTLVPTMRLSTWVDQRRRLRRIDVPSLTLYSPDDQVVAAEEIVQAVGWIGGAPRRLLPVTGVESASRHALAGDAVSPGTTERVRGMITAFLREALELAPPAQESPPAAAGAASPARSRTPAGTARPRRRRARGSGGRRAGSRS